MPSSGEVSGEQLSGTITGKTRNEALHEDKFIFEACFGGLEIGRRLTDPSWRRLQK